VESAKLRVLLVDDDKNIRQTLQVSLKGLGCEVKVASSAEEATRALKEEPIDFVLTDFKMEGKTGIDLVRFTRELRPAPVTVVMTAYASFENAVTAIKEGAFDYLPKPFSNAQLGHLLQKIRVLVELKHENARLKSRSYRSDYFQGMTSLAMRRLDEFVEKIAPTSATILMTGESGTGKSELARVIHERSERAKQPFVVVTCTSLAETLLESELFGHVKGAFTGATHDHLGKFEQANNGTVFLDEVGDLSLAGQSKLLRVLQEKVIERVGGTKSIPLNVRVIAATNKNLEEAVKQGAFREDLYFRLNVFECAVVPLRHRREDLPVLIEKFNREFSAQIGEAAPKEIPGEVKGLLDSYSWPGNIRELRNVIERLVLLSKNRQISAEDLPPAVIHPSKQFRGDDSQRLKTLEEVEREQIERVLSLTSSQEQAAETLGITTVTLWRKRKQLGLK